MPCRPEGQQLVIASAQMSPVCTTRSHDIEFTVAGHGKVQFVETRDPRFLTPEGIHVGSTLNDVRAVGGSQIRSEPGWRFFSTLPSGWNVAFDGIPDPRVTTTLNDKALGSSLFLRR
jgi:hypothetical protein